MANKHSTLKSLFTDIAVAIRDKTDSTNTIVADNFPSAIANINSDVTATASDVLSGKKIRTKDGVVTGNIVTKTSSNLTASGATVSVPAGYYASDASKSVATATQATPSISIDSKGLITASATQTAGYVSAGTKSATKQLTVQAAKTITPSSSSQTAVASGVYTTGAVTVAAVPTQTKTVTPSSSSQNVTPDSGKFLSKVTVAAVPSSYTQLNFTVVGGTTQPSSPTTNTIWVNTSTSITSWVFSSTQPTSPTSGMVWFQTSTSAATAFNALKTNNITVYPSACKQYVSGAWVGKTAKTYQSSAWKDWTVYIIKNGDCTNITGGWTATHSGAYGDGTLTVDENGLYWQNPWNNSGGGNTTVTHNTQIDFSAFKSFKFYIAEIGGTSIDKRIARIKSASGSVLAEVNFTTAGNWYSIDLSSITSKGYIEFYTSAFMRVLVSEAYLE